MKDFSKFINLGITIIVIILGFMYVGKLLNHIVIGIFTGVIAALAYLIMMALKQ